MRRLATVFPAATASASMASHWRPLRQSRRAALFTTSPRAKCAVARTRRVDARCFERLPKLKSGRWISIGRLDFNTSGLLLFTTDGELANALMHPSSNIEREYMVRVMGAVDEDILQRLLEGVMLEDGAARFTDIQDGGGDGINHWYYVVLMEGRNREVRRLWESQGLTVSRLKRVRYGNVFIPSRVKQGQWAELEPKEVKGLYELARLPVKQVKRNTVKEKEVMERQFGKRKAPAANAGRKPPRRPHKSR